MYKIKTNEELNLLYIIYLIYYIYIWLFLHVTLCRFIQLAFNLKKKEELFRYPELLIQKLKCTYDI